MLHYRDNERVSAITILATCNMLVIVLSCSACSNSSWIGTIRNEHPDIRTISHHAGAIFMAPNTHRSLSHTFVVHNPSLDKYMDLSVEAIGCSCTIVDIRPNPVKPGGEAGVHIRSEVGYQRVSHHDTVLLNTSLSEVPRIVLVLEADVYPRLGFAGDPTIPPHIPAGKRRSFEVLAYAFSPIDEAPAMLTVDTAGEGLSILPLPDSQEEELNNGVRLITSHFNLSIDCLSDIAGNYDGRELQGQLIARYGQYHLSRRIIWAPEVTIGVHPRQLFFNVPLHGEDTSHKVITLAGSQEFSVMDVDYDESLVEVTPTAEAGELALQHTIQVRIMPLKDSGRITRSSVVVKTDQENQPMIQVPISILWGRPQVDTP